MRIHSSDLLTLRPGVLKEPCPRCGRLTSFAYPDKKAAGVRVDCPPRFEFPAMDVPRHRCL